MQFSFSPKLKIYFLALKTLLLLATIIGIALLPFWAFFGPWWARRHYENLRLEVNDRSVVIAKGIVFKQELTIPLDRIQDISVREGPLLQKFGLLGLRIETAGQRNATTGQSEADLIGVVNAREVRDYILAQRDRLTDAGAQAKTPDTTALLTDIRDSLHRIEAKLDR